MERKLFTFFLALMASIGLTHAAVYSGTCGDNLTWKLNTIDRTLAISGTGAMTNWSFYTSVPWRSYRSYIDNITIENGVTSIGAYAFYFCDNLRLITLPNSISSIGNSAFSGCSSLPVIDNIRYADTYLIEVIDKSLTSYTIREETKWIGNNAFSQCSNLTSLSIPNSVTSINGSAFSWCSSLTSVTIPNSVTSIGSGAFLECSGLTSVTIPNNVTSIEYNTFGNCSSLTSVTIPNSVTSIGDYTFSNCSSLAIIEIPNSVTSIGNSAFKGCSGLTSINIPNSVTSIGNSAFSSCSSLNSVTIPNSVTSIGDYTFSNCSSLVIIEIPNSVTSIGNSAFSGCSSVTTIEIPNSVTNIGYSAFSNIPNIVYSGTATGAPWGAKYVNGFVEGYLVYSDETKTQLVGCVTSTIGEIVILNSVTSIGSNAFSGCSKLTSVSIPNSITDIGSGAFNNCSSLTKVNISDLAAWCSIRFANSDANPLSYAIHLFSNDEEIIDLVIPNNVSSIGEYAFNNCNSLTSVTIPNSVTSIGKYAFQNCRYLTSVTIPNSVTDIGIYAFFGVPNIVYSGTASGSQWGARSLNGFVDGWLVYSDESKTQLLACSAAATGEIIIPNSVTSIKNSAFYSCMQLNSIDIPNSVTIIGDYAFFCCKSLTSITIPVGLTNIERSTFAGCENIISVKWLARNCETPEPYKYETEGDHYYYEYSSASPFYGCTKLTTIEFGDEVENIPHCMCYELNELESVTIPASVKQIGYCAFSDYSSKLQYIKVESETPAILQKNTYDYTYPFEYTNDCPIYVPCGTYEDYTSAWSTYTNRLQYETLASPYSLTCSVNMEEAGYVQKPTTICDNMTITATAYNGYHFVQWSDGVTDNPRSIELTKDTTFTALFAMDKSGTCGKDLTLAWEFNEEKKTLTISGNGELTANYSYNIAAKYAQKIEFSEGVTDIGESAFNNCNNLTTLTLAKSVTNIARYAFYSCSNLATIYERSATPPNINSYSFNNNNIDVYVPFGGETRYKSAQVWKNMTIHAPTITKDANAHATSCVISFAVESTVLQSCGIVDDDIFPGNVIELTGLEPETEYNTNIVLTSNTGETETIEVSFTTTALELNTQPARLTSESSAVLVAYTNMADIETSCGFEFRRTGASDLVPSQMMNCAIANGTMAVKVNNIKAGVEYKYRPYYTSKQGNTKYGDWTAFDPIDAYIEYEPIVCTQTATGVTNSKATMRAMVVEGSSAISEQGFDVCAVGRQINNAQGAPRRAHKSVIGEHWTVPAEGTNMKVTLTDLDEGTTYTYRTYVIINGDTIFGSEQSFTTLGEYLYTVTFVDYDGTILGTDKVHYGDAATAPEDPIREGYEFTGWDNDFSNVTDDLTITATYSIATALPESTATQSKAQKLLHDGQLFIVLPDGTRYTATGMKVE